MSDSPSKDSLTRYGPRQWKPQGFIPFRLEVLTPVFVGSGEVFSPLEYVIRKGKGTDVLHLVDTAAWLRSEEDNPDLEAAFGATGAESVLLLRQLMDKMPDVSLFSVAQIPFTFGTLSTDMLTALKKIDSNSKVEIQTFVRNPVTNLPILPGSSLKGALSTPIIDHFIAEQETVGQQSLRQDKAYSKVMVEIFGGISEHSMQALKVSDIVVPYGRSRIMRTQAIKRNPGVNGQVEAHTTIPCEALSPAEGLTPPMYGRLLMGSGSGAPTLTIKGKAYMGKTYSLEKIKKWVNDYYIKRFHDEWEIFYTQPHFKQTNLKLQGVKKSIEQMDDNCLLIRVGHYSHKPCLTLTPLPGEDNSGKTRTLADGVWPFGWVMLHFCSEDDYLGGIKAVKVHCASKGQVQLADNCQTEEGVAREAELASLSPDERLLEELKNPDVPEEKSAELYKKLDKSDEAYKLKAATALRDYWKRINKWEGKLSLKQEEKVSKVKSILEDK